jgi:hypothetical protein
MRTGLCKSTFGIDCKEKVVGSIGTKNHLHHGSKHYQMQGGGATASFDGWGVSSLLVVE